MSLKNAGPALKINCILDFERASEKSSFTTLLRSIPNVDLKIIPIEKSEDFKEHVLYFHNTVPLFNRSARKNVSSILVCNIQDMATVNDLASSGLLDGVLPRPITPTALQKCVLNIVNTRNRQAQDVKLLETIEMLVSQGMTTALSELLGVETNKPFQISKLYYYRAKIKRDNFDFEGAFKDLILGIQLNKYCRYCLDEVIDLLIHFKIYDPVERFISLRVLVYGTSEIQFFTHCCRYMILKKDTTHLDSLLKQTKDKKNPKYREILSKAFIVLLRHFGRSDQTENFCRILDEAESYLSEEEIIDLGMLLYDHRKNRLLSILHARCDKYLSAKNQTNLRMLHLSFNQNKLEFTKMAELMWTQGQLLPDIYKLLSEGSKYE